jgi:hypothetical protein
VDASVLSNPAPEPSSILTDTPRTCDLRADRRRRLDLWVRRRERCEASTLTNDRSLGSSAFCSPRLPPASDPPLERPVVYPTGSWPFEPPRRPARVGRCLERIDLSRISPTNDGCGCGWPACALARTSLPCRASVSRSAELQPSDAPGIAAERASGRDERIPAVSDSRCPRRHAAPRRAKCLACLRAGGRRFLPR